MDQAVDVAIQADENTEISNRLDFAADFVAFVEAARKHIPRIFLALFDAERNTAALLVDIQHHNIHFIAHLHDFRRMHIFVGPIHFRDMHQTFHAFFQLSKAAVVSEVGDFRAHACTFWVFVGDDDPWIIAQLFHAQRNTVFLAVKLENFDINLITHRNDFAWVFDAFPSHIGDVQQTVHAAQINKRAVIGEVFNHTFNL